MAKHTQIIRRQFADELFEYVWPFCGVGAQKVKSRTICGYLDIVWRTSLIFLYVNHFWIFKVALKLSGHVEEIPGHKPSSSQRFWNFNSISAHNYIKLSLLRVYVSTQKIDAICISQTYLNPYASTVYKI